MNLAKKLKTKGRMHKTLPDLLPHNVLKVIQSRMSEVGKLFQPLYDKGKASGKLDAATLRDTVEIATVGLMATMESTADFCKLVEILDKLNGWKASPKKDAVPVVESDEEAIARALGKKDR